MVLWEVHIVLPVFANTAIVQQNIQTRTLMCLTLPLLLQVVPEVPHSAFVFSVGLQVTLMTPLMVHPHDCSLAFDSVLGNHRNS